MNEEYYNYATLPNLIRVTAIALATYNAVQIVTIYSMFHKRIALDTASRLMTAHARAVQSHILPTSMAVLALIAYAIMDLFMLLGLGLTWKGPYLVLVLSVMAFSLRKFCISQTMMLAQSKNWREQDKKFNDDRTFKKDEEI